MSITEATSTLAVELQGITKRFPGVVANRDISLAVRRGTIHAIVGENGAGKSTLMKILYGVQPPDEGTIRIDGEEISLTTPQAAIAAGIGMVFQHFMLADNLTVLENVVLGAEKLYGIGGRARAKILELGRDYGMSVDPDALVADLGVGDRQRIEILKVLYRGARILILDEPTAVLVPQEVTELFRHLQELKAEGLTVIFISHKLDEVLSVADDITVIRRGTTVAAVDPKDVTARQLAELMVGSELPTPQTEESTVTDQVVLEFSSVGLATAGGLALLSDIDLTIHAGEVVGIAGVEGNGQAELVEVVMGMRKPTSGLIRLAGEDITTWDTRRVREAGVGFIPEDRHRHGLLLESPLWENVILGHQTQPPGSRGALIDARGAQASTSRIVDEFDVRTPSIFVTAGSLSGGNQQKLILAREMEHDPDLLLVGQPTRGVDIGAIEFIHRRLIQMRDAGKAVLLVSVELDEILSLSDRIIVMYDGFVTGELSAAEADERKIGLLMAGVTREAA